MGEENGRKCRVCLKLTCAQDQQHEGLRFQLQGQRGFTSLGKQVCDRIHRLGNRKLGLYFHTVFCNMYGRRVQRSWSQRAPYFWCFSFRLPYVPAFSDGVLVLIRNVYQELTVGTTPLCKQAGKTSHVPCPCEISPGNAALPTVGHSGGMEQKSTKSPGARSQLLGALHRKHGSPRIWDSTVCGRR